MATQGVTASASASSSSTGASTGAARGGGSSSGNVSAPRTGVTGADTMTRSGAAPSARRDVRIPTSLAQYGPRRADNSPVDENGNPHRVNPNAPIPIAFDAKTRTYNPRAAAFVAQQNALEGGLSLDGARAAGEKSMGYSSSVDPGRDGGTWRLANGPAKGVLYGASMIGAAAYLGYHSAQDQADVAAWPNVETGETGSLSGKRHFSQRPGTGVAQGGQGPVQITAPYHDRRGANNPAYSAVQAITAGERTQGGHTARVKDAIIPYNSGVKDDKVGQSEGARGSYASYMQSVVEHMRWFWR